MQIVIHCSLLCTYNSLFVCSYWAFIFFLSLVLLSFSGHLSLFYVLLSLHPTSCLTQFAEADKKAQQSCAPAREECNKYDLTAALYF
jgi:hypothetical protein